MPPIEWFDDLITGMRFKSGEVQITASDIKRFATEFDPQPMHLDENSATKIGPHPLIGMGVDGLRWTAPVWLGDVLHLEGEVVSLTPSKTKPQGIALVKWTMYN